MKDPTTPASWQDRLRIVFKQYVAHDMRYAHIGLAIMVALGLVINLVLPHGWTVWPFVLAAAIILTIHELADRYGQGIPPLHVYAWFVGAMVLWLLVVLLLSVVNPLVVLLGLAVLGYFSGRGYLQQRARQRLIASRKAAGLCIHCGHVIDPGLAFCEGCGEDPDPEGNRLQRVASAPGGKQRKDHLRSILKPPPASSIAQQKEQALLARRHRKQNRR